MLDHMGLNIVHQQNNASTYGRTSRAQLKENIPSALSQSWRHTSASIFLFVSQLLYSLTTLHVVENAASEATVNAGAANTSLAISEIIGYLAECIFHHCRTSKLFSRGKRSSW
jgi:hypothetical protein